MLKEIESATKMFKGELSCLAFLQSLDTHLVKTIIEGSKNIAISRVSSLNLLLEKLDH